MYLALTYNQFVRLTKGIFCLVLFFGLISCQKNNNTPPASSQNKVSTPDQRDSIVGNYNAIDTIIFWGARVNPAYNNYYYVYHTTLTIRKDSADSSNIILSEKTGGDVKTWGGRDIVRGGTYETCFNISDQYFTTKNGLKYYILGSTNFLSPPSGGIYDAYIYNGFTNYVVTGNVFNYNYQGNIVNIPYTEKIVASK